MGCWDTSRSLVHDSPKNMDECIDRLVECVPTQYTRSAGTSTCVVHRQQRRSFIKILLVAHLVGEMGSLYYFATFSCVRTAYSYVQSDDPRLPLSKTSAQESLRCIYGTLGWRRGSCMPHGKPISPRLYSRHVGRCDKQHVCSKVGRRP